MNTFIIAEAGANHNRDFNKALRLIDTAVTAGCSAVKFQTYSSETLYASNTPDFAGYKDINKLIKDIELPREWQKDLKSYCDEKGIEFMSTPFDEQAVQELVDLGVKRLKIAGFEATDPRFVEMVASAGLPVIMSVGIGFELKYLGLYERLFKRFNNEVTLLHCNNAYPTPLEDVDLTQIDTLLQFNRNWKVGFSDHTISTLTPAFAVIRGAQVIEKHFTLDRLLPGPDHAFALEPEELTLMVKQIRDAEKTLTKSFDQYTPSEMSFKNARRSVVSIVELNEGDILTQKNITTKRPLLDNSIPANDFFSILGQTVLKKIPRDTPLPLDVIRR